MKYSVIAVFFRIFLFTHIFPTLIISNAVRIELENISSEEMAQLRAGMMVETEALRK